MSYWYRCMLVAIVKKKSFQASFRGINPKSPYTGSYFILNVSNNPGTLIQKARSPSREKNGLSFFSARFTYTLDFERVNAAAEAT